MNLEKSTLWTERLKRERELKSTMSERKFDAFTILSLNKLARVRETWGFLNNLYW